MNVSKANAAFGDQLNAWADDVSAATKTKLASDMATIDDDIFLMSSRKVPLSQAHADAVDQSTANGIAANLKARLGQQLEHKQRGLLSEFAKIDPLGGRSFMDAAYSPDAVLTSALRNVGASINPQRGIISDEVARFNSEIQEHNARMANEAGQSQGGWGDSIQPSPERLITLGQEVAKNRYIVDKLTSKEGWSSIGTMFKSSIINSLASNRPGFNFGFDPVDSFTESQRVSGVETLLAVPMAFQKELDVLSVMAMPRVPIGANSGTRPLQLEEIIAPNGRSIQTAVDGNAIVPLDKIAIYARGGVADVSEELSAWNQYKQGARKMFDANPENAARLKQLNDMQHNFDRSIDMGKRLDSIGLTNTEVNNNLLINHLLDTGQGVNPANRLWVPSIFEGPNGALQVKSTWKILDDNRAYLNTLMFVPVK